MDCGSIIGATFDGLKDRIATYPKTEKDIDKFYLSDVVIPETLSGKMLTGDESETSRICSGYSWPPEASMKDYIRRVPVALAWRILIDKGSRNVVLWNSSQSSSFKISKIISNHISSLLKSSYDNLKKLEKLVISIPNDLDEVAQERLIRELVSSKLCPKEKISLLWRPIATALEWLNNTQDKITYTITNEDFIISAYFGAESFELVPLRLRTREFENKRYIIPLREIPKNNHKTDFSGVHWVSLIIEKIIESIKDCNNKKGAFWQLFTGIPDIWLNLAYMKYKDEELPRAMNIGDSWTLWNPNDSFADEILSQKGIIKPIKSNFLEEIISNSLKSLRSNGERIFEKNDDDYTDIMELISDKFKNAMNLYSGKCLGVIISGPFSYFFADKCLPLLKEQISSKLGNLETTHEFKPFSIWLGKDNEEITHLGAVEYGLRLKKNQPTYLDTLSQICVFAVESGEQKWYELLKKNELEVEGGKSHENTLYEQFRLQKGSDRLHIYLKKGMKESKVNDYRYKEFVFPYSPSQDIVFDTRIKISPASGTVQIEFVPNKKDFLAGSQIFLDYSEMTITDKLPELELSYPEIEKINCDPIDSYISTRTTIDKLKGYVECNIDFANNNILEIFKNSTNELAKRLRIKRKNLGPDPKNGKHHKYQMISSDGTASTKYGNEIIQLASSKLEFDLKVVFEYNNIYKNIFKYKQTVNELLKLSNEFYCSAPENSKILLRMLLKSKGNIIVNGFRVTLEKYFAKYTLYASRIFTDSADIKLVFDSIYKIIENPEEKKSLYSRAILNLLSMRENSVDVIDTLMANKFIDYSMKMLFIEVEKKNFRSNFLINVGLIAFMLRYRKIEKFFLNPTDEFINIMIEKLKEFFKTAENFVSSKNKSKFEELSESVIDFMLGVGTGSLPHLNDLIDEQSDNDEDEKEEL